MEPASLGVSSIFFSSCGCTDVQLDASSAIWGIVPYQVSGLPRVPGGDADASPPWTGESDHEQDLDSGLGVKSCAWAAKEGKEKELAGHVVGKWQPRAAGEKDDDSDADSNEEANVEDAPSRLRERLPKNLRRAVRLEVALQNFGEHWRGNLPGRMGLAEQLNVFELSEPADRIDDFLSHDWSTPGWLKFLNLCLVYNGTSAIVTSISFSLVLGLLQTDLVDILPRPFLFTKTFGGEVMLSTNIGCFATFLGPASFLVALMFWQRLRQGLRCRSRRVFVDRLCVHQTDMDKKQKGIMALAGFLKLADKLVVLWSPRYLSRLWCVYELATWVHLQKQMNRVYLMPVALGLLVLSWFCSLWLFFMPLSLAGSSGGRGQFFRVMGIVSAVVVSPLPAFVAQRLSGDLHRMTIQLATFSARNAKCFCCANRHEDPETGGILPCDRMLVFETLRFWFRRPPPRTPRGSASFEAPSEVDNVDFLNTFDRFVQLRLAPQVLRNAGGARIPFQLALVVSVPAVGFCSDRLMALSLPGWDNQVRVIGEYLLLCFFLAPLMAKLMLVFAVWQFRTCGAGERAVTRVFLTLSISILWLLALLALWQAHQYACSAASFVPQLVYSLIVVVLVVVLFYRPRPLPPPPVAPGTLPPSLEAASAGSTISWTESTSWTLSRALSARSASSLSLGGLSRTFSGAHAPSRLSLRRSESLRSKPRGDAKGVAFDLPDDLSLDPPRP